MRFLLLFFFFCTVVFAAEVQSIKWQKGETFLTFLEKHKIPLDTYFKLSKTDKELCSEILAGSEYEILMDKNSVLLQALIPISDEMHIHIKKNQDYVIDFIPISYFEHQEILSFNVKKSPYDDILELTNNPALANEFTKNFKESFNFRTMRVGDVIKIKYKQKVRKGMFFSTPEIDGVYVESQNKKSFLVKQDGVFYNDKGQVLEKFFMKTPISYKRISSRFTLKRFHPVLKIYRAHLGVDYAANIGTKVYAAADGKISFRGIKGGYGKTVVVNHKNGYKTLYGHLSNYANIKIGSSVKQGTLIAYSGNSGVSSGPHLHFGVYKNDKPVDPLKVIKSSKIVVEPKRKQALEKISAVTKAELLDAKILNQSNLKLHKLDFRTDLSQNKQ